MPSINDVYGGDFLKADTLKQYQLPVPLTIKTIEIGSVKNLQTGEQQPQLVLHFHELDKRLGLNKTNADMIGHIHGENYEYWENRQIMLTVMPVSTPQGVKEGIRVVPQGQQSQVSVAPQAPYQPVPAAPTVAPAQPAPVAPQAAPVPPPANPLPEMVPPPAAGVHTPQAPNEAPPGLDAYAGADDDGIPF